MSRRPEICEHGNVGKIRCQECQRKWRKGKYSRLSESQRQKRHKQVAAWRERNRGRYKEITHKSRCKQYDITPEQYADLLTAQDGRCAICRTANPNGHGTWHIDHDHITNRVRGLLCGSCNAVLGYAKDDDERLMTAIAYLKNPPAYKILSFSLILVKSA